MSFSIAGKTAIITGGASGIGAAIATRFREQGANVLVMDRRGDESETFHRGDVSIESDIAAAFDKAIACFGRVNILINNAGIQPLGIGFEDLTGPLLDRTFAVNMNGVALGLKLAKTRLADAGRIINMASFVGMIATPRATAYAASKAAVIHLTKLAAIELAPRKITVNAISPGTILTPAVTDIPNNPEILFIEKKSPLGRLGQPCEVAALAHFLASDEAAYITGQNIAIDGGLTAGWTEYDLQPPSNVREGAWHDDL